MSVIEEPRQATDVPAAEVLIKEARQRQRRRRLLVGIIVLTAVVVSSITYAIANQPSSRSPRTGASSPTKPVSPSQSGPFVSPRAPYALAVASNGDLLVVDSARDQILRRLSSGKFQAVAGDGERGFSGDEGPATRARINVQDNSGIVVARDGTVYFSDTGNGRVREILPNGIIKTIVGGGTRPLGQGSMPALSASINEPLPEELAGLAIGANGELYVAADGVYRLGPGGILRLVVGKADPPKDWPKSWDGPYSNPAIQPDFTKAQRLAFDGNGDLLVAGGGGYGLYEMTKDGRLLFLETFMGEEAWWGSLAEATGGTVVLADRRGVSRLSSSGSIKLMSPSVIGANSPLSAALAEPHQIHGFICGDGVAVGRNGDIYLDTNAGNGWTSVSGILELRPNGKVVALWKS
jgi:hypothetical protein